MKLRFILLLFALALIVAAADAQFRVLSVEQLPVSQERPWMNPRFSPDGKSVLFTSDGFNGIWIYSLETKQTRQITDDAGAGYGFTVSDDGSTIAYRRTIDDAVTRERTQEIVTRPLAGGAAVVHRSASDLSLPAFAKSAVVYDEERPARSVLAKVRATDIQLLGIERTKILLSSNGAIFRYDPLPGGSYIWPSLSPDGTLLAAYEMSKGAFISDLEGNVKVMLGRRDAPVWTRSGKWIVYMDDKDDGHFIQSSDIMAVSPDGTQTVRLTDTPLIIELNPSCSSVENAIVFNTLNGDLYILRYEE